MNSIAKRALVALSLWLAAYLHLKLCADVPNTPEGMFLYHGGAALFDFATLAVSAYMLEGRLSDDMQALCFASMVVNFTGFLLYVAYAPPTLYDRVIEALGYVQYIRLVLGDHATFSLLGSDMVHRPPVSRSQLHFEKENRWTNPKL